MTTVEIETRLGRIRGIERLGARAFLGVRYAGPAPRFRPCVQSDGWMGTYDATSHKVIAMQPELPSRERLGFGPPPPGRPSEDCHVLSIYAPAAASQPLPVFVWIHGGGFTDGSGNGYDGSALAMSAPAVVVTVNYRLGYFGLVDARQLGADYAQSVNLFLTDQIVALQWIRDNISDYGGDPHNVTVIGQSAGGASTLLLASSDHTAGLIHRAVACSPSAIQTSQGDHMAMLGARLNRPAEEVLSYLLEAPAEEVALLALGQGPPPFVDGTVIAALPSEAFIRRGAASLPVVTGYAPHEGLFLHALLEQVGLPDEIIRIVDHQVAASASGENPPEGYLARLGQLHDLTEARVLSDAVWTDLCRRGAVAVAEGLAQVGGKAWLYEFDATCQLVGSPVPSTHCVDIPFTFNWFRDPDRRDPLVSDTEDNRILADRWVATLVQFARTDDPAGPLGDWPPYDAHRRQSLTIGAHPHVVEDRERAYRTSVWCDDRPQPALSAGG